MNAWIVDRIRVLAFAVLASVLVSCAHQPTAVQREVVMEEFMIPAEETHRIRCDGRSRGRILEIAYGYTTEDDTQRLEDPYGRALEPDW